MSKNSNDHNYRTDDDASIDTATTEAGAGFLAGERRYVAPETVAEGGVPFAIVPEGVALTDVEKLLPAPTRTRATVQVFDVESFANYLSTHGEGRTEVFASVSKATITGVLDANKPDAPSWEDHKAVLAMQLSDDWKAWAAIDGKPLSQTAFAEFLEDHAVNVQVPEAARVIEIVTAFENTRTANFKSVVNIHSGLTQFKYSETEGEGQRQGEMSVPRELTLGIKPFKGVDSWAVGAKLRYRVNDGKLTFTVLLDRPQEVLEAAFRKVVIKVEEKTNEIAIVTA